MSTGEQPPTNASREPPRWVQRLRGALQWYMLAVLGTILLDTGELPIHLSGALQRLADIMVAAEFVVFLPAGFIGVVAAMRLNPATSWPEAWGRRLLVAGGFGLGVLFANWYITGLLPEGHRSNIETLMLAVLGALMFVLVILGLVLVVVAIIGEIRQDLRSRHRRPPANSGV